MKNPWMSAWLSAANKNAGMARGFWAAEAQRQQNAFVKEMARISGVTSPKKRASPKRRAK